jgi:hypothetical protein
MSIIYVKLTVLDILVYAEKYPCLLSSLFLTNYRRYRESMGEDPQKSPVREYRTPGSVRGRSGKSQTYLD